MRLAFLYTPSELTPWKENVNPFTLETLVKNTPQYYETQIICFSGFNEEMRIKLSQFDIVFNLCYGYQDAGQVEVAKWLESHSILHTASSSKNMLLAQDKSLLPNICKIVKGNTPQIHFNVENLENKMLYIAKPRKGSCHRDIIIANGQWLKTNLDIETKDLIIQPYIVGREFSVAVIPSIEGDYHYALPPIEIISCDKSEIFIAGQSYGKTERKLNPEITFDESENLMAMAEDLHKIIGLRSMSRTDFRIDNDGIIYTLDVNAMPNLDPDRSLMPALCLHHGIDMENLVSRLIKNSLLYNKLNNKNSIPIEYGKII